MLIAQIIDTIKSRDSEDVKKKKTIQQNPAFMFWRAALP